MESRERRGLLSPATVCSGEPVSNPGYREGQKDFLEMDRKTSTLIQSLQGEDGNPGPGSGAISLSDFPNSTLTGRGRLEKRDDLSRSQAKRSRCLLRIQIS